MRQGDWHANAFCAARRNACGSAGGASAVALAAASNPFSVKGLIISLLSLQLRALATARIASFCFLSTSQ